MVPAACHIHSDWSYDAKWKLQDLASELGRKGYRVVMMTDHDKGFSEERRLSHREACAQASSEKVLMVPGIEYADPNNVVHTLVWGPVPFLGEGLPTLEVLKGVKAAGGLAVMAHPSRRQAWKLFQPEWADYLLGMEMWNRKADGWAPSPDAQRLMKGTSLMPFVSLDFHASNQLFPLSMAMQIKGDVSENSVLDCMRARNCKPMAFSEPAQEVLDRWERVALKPAEKFRRTGASLRRWLGKRMRG